jgi:L-iditol 2-dehydrogenase
MKAAVLYGPADLRPAEVETPRIGADEVLVRVQACAICGTDMRIIDGTKSRGIHFPSIIGHEIAGEIAEVGPEVKGYAIGERVAIAPVIPCLRCYYCKRALENTCADREAIGYEYDGGFAQYVRIPSKAMLAGSMHRIPAHLSFEEAALAEPLACCINGNEISGIRLGDTVLLVGAGPIGLMHLQLARAAGAGLVIVSELLPHRREAALRFGADHAVDPAETDLGEFIRGKTEGLGVDHVVMAIGANKVVNSTLSLVRKGGTVNLFAGFPGKGEATIESNIIHYNELKLTGTSSSARRHYGKALGLIATGAVKVKELVTKEYPIEDVNEAMNTTRRGEGFKTIVKPWL